MPLFVSKCIQCIETEKFLKTVGIYRKNGNGSLIQGMRIKIDEGKLEVLENEEDAYVLTGALKLFFRELKEPIISWNIVGKLFEATKQEQKYSQIKELLNALPQPNKATLTCLMTHLYEVNKFSNDNQMEYSNIAIVFGPTLMWQKTDDRMSLYLVYLEQLKEIVKEILLGFDEIFPLIQDVIDSVDGVTMKYTNEPTPQSFPKYSKDSDDIDNDEQKEIPPDNNLESEHISKTNNLQKNVPNISNLTNELNFMFQKKNFVTKTSF